MNHNEAIFAARWHLRRDGRRLSDADVFASLEDGNDLPAMMKAAAELRDRGHGATVSYSRKVFIPLTQLCRDSCHYCTFAHPPRRGTRAYLSKDEVLAIARAGAEAGCHEALFTLGDKPEQRYRIARDELAQLGHATTISYLREMAALVLEANGSASPPQRRCDERGRAFVLAVGFGVAGSDA